jgi:hypothetical protein
MLRGVLLWALILVLPFGGMRVMCVEAPLLAPGAAHHQHGSDCERLCPLPEPVASPRDGSDCSMSVDNSLIVISAAVCTSPMAMVTPAIDAAQHDFSDHPARYHAPGLSPTTPPPKA